MLEGWGKGRGGIKGENWENCNSIINKKKYLKKKRNMNWLLPWGANSQPRHVP